MSPFQEVVLKNGLQTVIQLITSKKLLNYKIGQWDSL